MQPVTKISSKWQHFSFSDPDGQLNIQIHGNVNPPDFKKVLDFQISYQGSYLPIEAETNGRHFLHDIFKCIFLNENVLISIKISLKFVPKGQINNIPALV